MTEEEAREQVNRLIDSKEFTWVELYNLMNNKMIANKTGQTKADKLLRNSKIRLRYEELNKQYGGMVTLNRICIKIGNEFKIDSSQVYRIIKSK